MRKQRLREVKTLNEGHTACEWWRQDSDSPSFGAGAQLQWRGLSGERGYGAKEQGGGSLESRGRNWMLRGEAWGFFSNERAE